MVRIGARVGAKVDAGIGVNDGVGVNDGIGVAVGAGVEVGSCGVPVGMAVDVGLNVAVGVCVTVSISGGLGVSIGMKKPPHSVRQRLPATTEAASATPRKVRRVTALQSNGVRNCSSATRISVAV